MLRPPCAGVRASVEVVPSGAVTVTGRSSGSSDCRVTLSWSPSIDGAQIVFLEIGLLHQPIGEAAQQFGLRPAALEAARPQPHLVGQELRDAALADPVEHQQRLAVARRS